MITGLIRQNRKTDMATIRSRLERCVGRRVSVYCGPPDRNSFQPSICVCGNLERNRHDADSFRVLVRDGIYAYFTTANVLRVIDGTACGHRFRDGSTAVIRVSV
jgi:hypothetical protein